MQLVFLLFKGVDILYIFETDIYIFEIVYMKIYHFQFLSVCGAYKSQMNR